MSTPPADPYGAQGEPFREPGPHPAGGAPAAGYGAGHRGPMKNGLGIAALVVGVLSLPAAFTIIGGVVLGLLAIVLGLVGRGRARCPPGRRARPPPPPAWAAPAAWP